MDSEQIISALEKMTVLELNALVKQLEERWGVTAAAPVAMGAAPAVGAGAAAAAAAALSVGDASTASPPRISSSASRPI